MALKNYAGIIVSDPQAVTQVVSAFFENLGNLITAARQELTSLKQAPRDDHGMQRRMVSGSKASYEHRSRQHQWDQLVGSILNQELI